jgi:hypothetical protein
VNDQNRSTVVVISTGRRASRCPVADGRARAQVREAPVRRRSLSSSVIPEQTAIHRVLDGLYRSGADVFHVRPAGARVGHAHDELKLMLNLAAALVPRTASCGTWPTTRGSPARSAFRTTAS